MDKLDKVSETKFASCFLRRLMGLADFSTTLSLQTR